MATGSDLYLARLALLVYGRVHLGLQCAGTAQLVQFRPGAGAAFAREAFRGSSLAAKFGSTIDLPDTAATLALARDLAPVLRRGGIVYLRGELGAGKTTFARGVLRALGVGERIKSPTYSLLERYQANGHDAFHLDLYRIAAVGELEWLGLDELDTSEAIVLVEWPERGYGALPPPDLEVTLEHAGSQRSGRLRPCSPRAHGWLAQSARGELGSIEP
jgi:tRNA threonylcarbamoyladenosine biosynthesis protein TsaE